MEITFFLVTLVWLSKTQAGGRGPSNQEKNEVSHGPQLPIVQDTYPTTCEIPKPAVPQNFCENVLQECKRCHIHWTRCYEERIATCGLRGRLVPNFIRFWANSSQVVEVSPTIHHRVHIPSSALQMSRGAVYEEEVLLVATVLNSSFFEPSPPPRRGRGRAQIPTQPHRVQGTVLGGSVLAVKAGKHPVKNLSQPIKLTFKHDLQEKNGTCVFWQESGDGTGYWSKDGCDTSDTGTEFICSCNHMSFFAVLVNPEISVDKSNAVILTYIACTGSVLSVFFTFISLTIHICLQRRRPEKTIRLHMQLTGALLCLHLSFLLCSLWVWLLKENEEDWVCQLLGLFLHWSLLASLSWMALEGFHLYRLLVRVFNIYVRRYLLKLSLVGWGLPTLTVVVCGISGVYGKYDLEVGEDNNHTSTVQMCWLSSRFPQMQLVSHITTMALPCLVVLCNSIMLGLVVFKLWKLRGGSGGIHSTGGWMKMNREKVSRLWKDCVTVLGLSCVLGLTWGLASTTYISLPWIYVFTILNSLQGVFMFLWSLALTCKSQSENNSSVRDPSSQKMTTTSFIT